jgi:hypothetical protein
MASKALFKYLPGHQAGAAGTVSVLVNGAVVRMSPASSLAAGLLAAGITAVRVSSVGQGARAPYCMMGVCFDCLVSIDGQGNQQACMVPVREGMVVTRQQGRREAGQ